MSGSRLPPIRSASTANNDASLEVLATNSENVTKPRRKKGTVGSPSDDQVQSEAAVVNAEQQRRRPRTLSIDNQATDESGGEGLSSRSKPARRKRKPQASISNEQLVSDVTEPTENVERVTTRKKAKAKSRRNNTVTTGDRGLASELTDLDEDIMDTEAVAITTDPAIAATVVMKSEPTQKVYVEKSSGFKAADKTKLSQKRAQAADAANKTDEEVVRVNTVDFALSTHRVFKVIAVFLQGTFAGIALWQIVSSSMLITSGSSVFSLYYMPLSIPVQCLYFFLFAVACVAALDRYDLASANRRLLIRSVSFQAGTVCIVFYFCGLIISLGTGTLDEGIGLNQTALLTNQTASSSCQWLCQWQILNIFRGVLAILGWFVISMRPETDRLRKSLLKANDDILVPKNTSSPVKQTAQPDSTLWTTQTA